MFSISNNKFVKELKLSKRVSNDVITDDYLKYFDSDGFELSYLECEYYRENNVEINNILNHRCDQKVWLDGGNDKFKIDHSMILQRWEFVNEAREQLLSKKTKFPQLNKYLNIVPKWGLDFSLEYYKNDEVLEVLHIETDYRDYEEALDAKSWFEYKILSTDWEDFVVSLKKEKSQWENLPGMQQNDWKAVYWGLNRAEITYKAFV